MIYIWISTFVSDQTVILRHFCLGSECCICASCEKCFKQKTNIQIRFYIRRCLKATNNVFFIFLLNIYYFRSSKNVDQQLMYLRTVHKILIQRVRLLAQPLPIQACNGWMKNLLLKILFFNSFFKNVDACISRWLFFLLSFFKRFQILAATIVRNEELKTE